MLRPAAQRAGLALSLIKGRPKRDGVGRTALLLRRWQTPRDLRMFAALRGGERGKVLGRCCMTFFDNFGTSLISDRPCL